MGCSVCSGAVLQCSFGAAPGTLTVLPANRTMTSSMPAATIMDCAPMVNVAPFGMCSSMANPMVIAATAAALGVPTPMPCVPVPAGPWVVGAPTVMLGGMPMLNADSKLMCAWAGVIQITFAGQVACMVP